MSSDCSPLLHLSVNTMLFSSKAAVRLLSTMTNNSARRSGLPLRLVGASESCAPPTHSYPRGSAIKVLRPASSSCPPLIGATESCEPPVKKVNLSGRSPF